jgi:iron(III) transport system ATP-binding protein
MLSISNLSKSYEGSGSSGLLRRGVPENERVAAIDDVSLEIAEGEMFTLLGPSGCGKTTTLRSVAGLETPDSGTITLNERQLFSADGARVVNVPANERGLGMVFQSYAIWPHLTVFDNVAFPLQVGKRRHRLPRQEIATRVERVLATMELEEYAGRPATNLSGGQQQRLALARAIVIEPPLLLLDEPLSNLDAKLRESLRYELKRLQRELGITSVYVTHDQIEALALSSSIAVMRQGRVVQIGRPRDIYERPNSRFVAEFIGTSNFVAGRVVEKSADGYLVETPAGPLLLPSEVDLPSNQDVVVSARPESIGIATTDALHDSRPNRWCGTVVTRAYLGDAVDHLVKVGGLELRVRGNPQLSIEPDSTVVLTLKPENLTLVPID